ncbi:MAG: LamG domain-containing protein [Sedimentisphaerales bacterium]
MKYKSHNNTKGMVLIIVLILVGVITIVGLGFIVRGDAELAFGQNMEMKADMDCLADAGLEHGRGLVMCPHDLAGEPNVYSAQQLDTGSDYYDVNVTKTSELDFQIKSDAYRMQNGSKFATNSLTAKLRLDPAVAFWTNTGCQFNYNSNVVVNGDVYCSDSLENDGIINGDCFADALTGTAATGRLNAKTALTTLLSRPTITYALLTSNFATQPIGSSSLNNVTLSGTPVVYYRNGDLKIISDVVINGCLAVNGDLTITGTNNIITAKKNAPAIYVSGNLILKEGARITIDGLVFVDGRIEMPVLNQSTAITGSLIVDDGIRYILPDYSSNHYDGVINGDCVGADGKLDGAINFDGSGDYVDIGNAANLNITSKITVAAWIKVNTFDKAYQAVITKGDSSWRLQRYSTTGRMEFSCSGTSNPILIGIRSINDGLWHHVAGVYTGIRMYLYVDGVLDNYQDAIGSISTNSAPVYIGENSEATGRYFNGRIDSVKVWKKGLSSVEIWELYTGGSPAGTDLVGCWYMNTGGCSTTINAAPLKAAVWHWPSGVKDRWSPAAGAFYKSIVRN